MYKVIALLIMFTIVNSAHGIDFDSSPTDGAIDISIGGTGANNIAGARTNLDLYSTGEVDIVADTAVSTHVALPNPHTQYLQAEVDGSVTNEIQTLSILGTDITLTSGGTITIPAGVNADWNAISGDSLILNKPTIPATLAELADDATHRIVTDTEKATWNSKEAAGTADAGIVTHVALPNPHTQYLQSEVDGSVTNEIQSLSILGNDITISDGNTISIPATSSTATETAFTPTGGIAATNVQAGIAEVDAEKANKNGVSLNMATLADLKIVNEQLVDDATIYGDADDNVKLWSVEKTAAMIAVESGFVKDQVPTHTNSPVSSGLTWDNTTLWWSNGGDWVGITGTANGLVPDGTIVDPLFADYFNRADSAVVGGAWDNEFDNDGKLSISSGELYYLHDSTSVAYVQEDFGQNVTEFWVELDITFDDVTDSNIPGFSTQDIARFFPTGSTTYVYDIVAQVSNDTERRISAFRVNYNGVDTVSVGSGAVTVNVDIPTNIKVHVREGGAGDLIQISINDVLKANDSGVDLTAGNVAGMVRLGAPIVQWQSWLTQGWSIDNFKFYTADPTW